MGWNVAKNNYITYHHIWDNRNGGEESVSNGALLTRKAHEYLNITEIIAPKLYDEYQYWFRLINDSKFTPNDEIMSIHIFFKEKSYESVDNLIA